MHWCDGDFGRVFSQKMEGLPTKANRPGRMMDQSEQECKDLIAVLRFTCADKLLPENDAIRVLNYLSDGGVEREEIVGGCVARSAKTGYMEVRMFLALATKELRDWYIEQMDQQRFGRDFPKMFAPQAWQGGIVVVPN